MSNARSCTPIFLLGLAACVAESGGAKSGDSQNRGGFGSGPEPAQGEGLPEEPTESGEDDSGEPPVYAAWRLIDGFDLTMCGLLEDETADCWGEYGYGSKRVPERRYSELSLGFTYGCGVDTDGETICWGAERVNTTADEPPEGQFHGIAAGGYQTCALDEQGLVRCWGYTAGGDWLPPSGTPALQVDAGQEVYCALLLDGSIDCWGERDYLTTPEGDGYVELAVGWYHVCARRADGSVECAGGSLAPDEMPDPPEEDRFVAISSGLDVACGVLVDGGLACWGDPTSSAGTRGILGERPRDRFDWVDVSVSGSCACALDAAGVATCWGDSRCGTAPNSP